MQDNDSQKGQWTKQASFVWSKSTPEIPNETGLSNGFIEWDSDYYLQTVINPEHAL